MVLGVKRQSIIVPIKVQPLQHAGGLREQWAKVRDH